jgi:hypothetical protein
MKISIWIIIFLIIIISLFISYNKNKHKLKKSIKPKQSTYKLYDLDKMTANITKKNVDFAKTEDNTIETASNQKEINQAKQLSETKKSVINLDSIIHSELLKRKDL